MLRDDSFAYRPDIDGLRAVAVVAVLVFHAFSSLAPGGFVGVDIFFVISGYLITGILVDDVRRDRFSVAKFYARRIRRIFPALIVVLLAVIGVGRAVLYPDEFVELGRHVLAGAGFVSNLLLWSETGYFDQAAQAKPLLHLWSLGVEEQYYIIWPLVLAMAHKRRQTLVTATVFIFALSFALNVHLVGHHPAAAFFSPFTRFWELMVGSALALNVEKLQRISLRLKSLASLIGAALCGAAIFGLNEQNYPGWWAVLPTLGAALIIAAGSKAAANRTLLSRSTMVGVGKISYPLYLWHWPLLSLAFVAVGGSLSASARVGLLLLSALLAWMTYVAIENPVRRWIGNAAAVAVPCLGLLLAGGAGALAYAGKIDAQTKKYSAYGDPATATHGAGGEFLADCGVKSHVMAEAQCFVDARDPPRFAMIGDSKTEAVIHGFIVESRPGERWMMMSRAGCAPVTSAVRSESYAGDDPSACAAFAQLEVQTVISKPEVRLVVIATARRVLFGVDYVDEHGSADRNGAYDGLNATVSTLERAGKQVAFLIDNPTLPNPTNCMERRVMKYRLVRALASTDETNCTVSLADHLEQTADYLQMVKALKAAHPDMLVLDPTPLLCDEAHDICSISENGRFLYSYGDHVSDTAGMKIARQFIPVLTADGLR